MTMNYNTEDKTNDDTFEEFEKIVRGPQRRRRPSLFEIKKGLSS